MIFSYYRAHQIHFQSIAQLFEGSFSLGARRVEGRRGGGGRRRKETEKAGRGEKEGEEGNRRKRKKPSALCAGALGLEIQLCYVSRPTASSFPAPRGRHW